MNWNTQETAEAGLRDPRADRCEHVRENPQLAHTARSERDSFGAVDRVVLCQACADAARDAVAAEKVRCHDCNRDYPRRETISWRWYDFYAPQGDEPLTLCQLCQKSLRHILRVERDDAARSREMSGYDE